MVTPPISSASNPNIIGSSEVVKWQTDLSEADRTAAESAGVETEEDNLSGHQKQGRGQGSVKGTIPNTAYQGGSLWSQTISES